MTTQIQKSAEQGLQVMAKPIGPICNLACEYCYYLRKEAMYPGQERWRMSDETLGAYVSQYIAAQPASAEEIMFGWQGGEPTLLGVDFFRRVVEIQDQHARPGMRVVNTLQTNGVLLDDAWCDFFREHGFLIGLSIDGPAELHDRYRYDKRRRPTVGSVLRGLRLLDKHGVEFNALVAINRHNGDHGRRVYTYLRDSGIEFFQFIPVVERRRAGPHADRTFSDADGSSQPAGIVTSWSVLPEQFGDFLIEVFDEWIKQDVGRVFVQSFDQALGAWLGIEPSLCVFRKRCGRALVIEHNGDLFSCDHFVEPAHKLGNIHQSLIAELARSPQQMRFGGDKETTLPQYCRECPVRFVCNGECPRNRFATTPDGEPGLNYLCAGYRRFFNHVDPFMKMMAEELQQQRPAANVMQRLKAEPRGSCNEAVAARRSARVSPGRNDPCPCGSGRKFKKCCISAAH